MRFFVTQILLVLLVCLSFQASVESRGIFGRDDNECRYWCKTPENESYCCEESEGNPDKVKDHKGKCPPTRSVCPAQSSGNSPQSCSHDGSCGRKEKCCFDRCIDYHICKPAENVRG